MEEVALELSADGIQKKVLSPGKGEIPDYLDGSKVKYTVLQYLRELKRFIRA